MKKPFEEEQIVRILRDADDSGVQVRDVCRRHNITEQTFFRGRKEYGGLKGDQAKRLKELEGENARRKKLVAGLSLEKEILKDVVEGNSYAPSDVGRL